MRGPVAGSAVAHPLARQFRLQRRDVDGIQLRVRADRLGRSHAGALSGDSAAGHVAGGRMGDAIRTNAANLQLDANAVAAYFNADGTPKTTGTVTTNLPYAQSLRLSLIHI